MFNLKFYCLCFFFLLRQIKAREIKMGPLGTFLKMGALERPLLSPHGKSTSDTAHSGHSVTKIYGYLGPNTWRTHGAHGD